MATVDINVGAGCGFVFDAVWDDSAVEEESAEAARNCCVSLMTGVDAFGGGMHATTLHAVIKSDRQSFAFLISFAELSDNELLYVKNSTISFSLQGEHLH